MHQTLLTLAIIGYVAATGLALAYLVRREEMIHRLASLATLAGWACHTLGLVALAVETGRLVRRERRSLRRRASLLTCDGQ